MKKRKAKRRPVEGNSPVKVTLGMPEKESGFGYQMPPDFEYVVIYFSQKGQANLAGNFFEEQSAGNWKTPTGFDIKNWKVAATEWIFNNQQSLKLLERKKANNF